MSTNRKSIEKLRRRNVNFIDGLKNKNLQKVDNVSGNLIPFQKTNGAFMIKYGYGYG